MRVLLFSPTDDRITGADRDWINLAGAFSPEKVTITWVGIRGTRFLRPLLPEGVVPRLIDIGFVPFNYCIQENAYRPRSPWLWCKILVDHVLRQGKPLRQAMRLGSTDSFDVVVSNTAAVTLGAVVARLLGVRHVWFVKEILDERLLSCRVLAKVIRATSDTIVVPSEASARPFRGSAEVVGDGCMLGMIERARSACDRAAVLSRLGLPPASPVVVQCGGLVWWKGQHVTLEAWRRLAAGGGPPPCSLVLLGEGSQEKVSELRAAISGLPTRWQEAVHFTASPPDDLAVLAAADLVVHPSVLPDPYPNAVREAMLLGKPVIGSADGGLVEMIRHGVTGFLVPPGDAEALAEAMQRFLKSGEERQRIGAAARAFALLAFDISRQEPLFARWLRP